MPGDRAAPAQTIEPNAAAAQSRGAAEGDGPRGRYRRAAGTFFTVDPVFLGAAAVEPYERRPGDPLYRPLRIYALDPAASRLDGAVVTVNLPYEELRPGPCGATLEVVDWDQTAGETHPPVDLDDRRVLIRDGRDPSLADVRFHQQMAYAVCASTYNAFRVALGRDPAWGFAPRPGADRPRLRIRPHAFREENACYDPEAGELNLGYFDAAGAVRGRNLPFGRVYTCLSHDVVAHEMTHALLDGMRARFRLPTNPDVLAFHEGLADLVAIFLRFSYRDVVRAAIERSPEGPERDALLLSVATQFGQTTGADGPLRSAIDAAGLGRDGAGGEPRRYDEAGGEPHALGTVLVSAVFEAFAAVFRRKTAAYRRLAGPAAGPGGRPGAELAEILAREASRLAAQFLSVCVRAVDYCPPLDLRLGEYLRALVTADHDLVPDDPFGYREALVDAFARRGIYPEGVQNLSEDALLWRAPERRLEPLAALHFRELRFAGDPGRAADEAELRRQAEAFGAYVMRPGHAAEFGCALPGDPALDGDRVEPATVCSVRSLRRIGPDKEVTFDLVAEIVQRRWFAGRGGGPDAEFHGGATAVLGPDGAVRYVIRKSITDRRRAEAQAAHLEAAGPHGGGWEARGGRLRLPRVALRELHRRATAAPPAGWPGGGPAARPPRPATRGEEDPR